MTVELMAVLDKYGVEYDPEKSGNQKVLCVWHADHNPSGSVNLDEGVYMCFACDARGNAVTLIEQQEGLSYSEAERVVQELVGKAGTAVPRRPDRGSDYLPRKSRNQGKGRQWRSPWSRQRP